MKDPCRLPSVKALIKVRNKPAALLCHIRAGAFAFLRLGEWRHTLALAILFLLPAGLAAGANAPALIPLPEKVECRKGQFRLGPGTEILVDGGSKASGQYLAERLRKSTGYKLKVRRVGRKAKAPAGRDNILLATDKAMTNCGPEGYELTVSPDSVVVRGAEAAGVFYGVQTVLELLPPEALAPAQKQGVDWTMPCVRIEDRPRFKWRGLMLDVSRHFFNQQEVERLLDVMALHKLNVFHWHLVDDQGWRLEIKKYPRLTQIGAWRKGIGFDLDPQDSTAYGPDGRYGGFYTQAQVREIVAYAQARHITVVPEIEMPGHSVAALMAYPQYSCTGGPFSTDINAGIFNGVFCAGNEETFTFLENVLTEVFKLFPSQYIHIGGDEAPKENWEHCPKCQARMKQEGLATERELQSYFIRRIEKFINAHGRTLIGWSEIREGGLARNAAVMDWIGGGVEAAREGHDVVMAPCQETYLCYYPSWDRPPKLRAYRPYLPLSRVYAFEPMPAGLEAQYRSHILGAQACVWTVYFSPMSQVEEMTFPRLCALAEVVWSPKPARNWDDFKRRLRVHCRRLAACGVNYWQDRAVKLGNWEPSQLTHQSNLLEWDIPPRLLAAGQCRLSLDYTGGKNGLKIAWAALLEDGHEIARDAHVGFTGGTFHVVPKPKDWNYYFQLPAVKSGAHYAVRVCVAGEGGTDSSGVVCLEPPAGSKQEGQ